MPENSVSGRGLKPAYLVVGEDGLKRMAMRKRLEGRISEMGDLSLNLEVFNGADADVEQVLTACSVLPFASEMRLVVIEDCDKLAAPAQKQLCEYVASPNKTTVLALFAEKLPARCALAKAFSQLKYDAVVHCDMKKKGEMSSYVARMAASHGVTIAPQAANLLVDLTGGMPQRMDSELAKLSAIAGPGAKIGRELVEGMVARTSQAKPWELTDALAMRDAKALAGVLSRLDTEKPFGLLASCVKSIRELIVVKAMCERGQDGPGGIAKRLGCKEWKASGLAKKAQNFSMADLEEALVQAAGAEASMKTGAPASETFKMWLMGVCSGIYQ